MQVSVVRARSLEFVKAGRGTLALSRLPEGRALEERRAQV